MTYKSGAHHDFAWRRHGLLRAAACLLLGLSGISLAMANPIELVRVGFYEGTPATRTPEWGSPRIVSTFAQDTTRSVSTLFQIRGHQASAAGRDTRLTVHYLHPDGHQLGEDIVAIDHGLERETLELSSAWGGDTPNRWDAGFYRVEIRLDDGTPIGEGRFLIKADTRFVTLTGGVRFEQLGFYEAGEDGMEQPPESWSDARLRKRFAQSEARYIFAMLKLKNLKWNIEDQDVKIHLYYYRPDGEMFGDPVIDYSVPADWETIELWSGWGWPEAGSWHPGRYRVELWLDDVQKIGQGHFDID